MATKVAGLFSQTGFGLMVKSTLHGTGFGGGPPEPEQGPISTWILAVAEQTPFETTTVKINEPPPGGKVPGTGVYDGLVAVGGTEGPDHWYVV